MKLYLYALYTLNNEFIKETNVWPDNFTGIHAARDKSIHYYKNGIRTRLDGPAIIRPNGTEYYYIDGKEVTKLEHKLLHSLMRLKGLL